MINVHAVNEVNHEVTLNFKVLETCCRKILKDNGHQKGDVTYIFTTDDVLNKLKLKYFKIDVLTDVIAFNLEDEGKPIEGEIYISWDRTQENARIYSQEIATELKRMVIHGSLHLVGFDDKTEIEKNEMKNLEDTYIMKFSDSIIGI